MCSKTTRISRRPLEMTWGRAAARRTPLWEQPPGTWLSPWQHPAGSGWRAKLGLKKKAKASGEEEAGRLSGGAKEGKQKGLWSKLLSH